MGFRVPGDPWLGELGADTADWSAQRQQASPQRGTFTLRELNWTRDLARTERRHRALRAAALTYAPETTADGMKHFLRRIRLDGLFLDSQTEQSGLAI